MPNDFKPSAMIGPCDDCGTPGPVLNCNNLSNPYMLCGRCQYAHLGDIDAGQDWHSAHGPGLGLTMFNDRIWLFGRQDGLTTIDSAEVPELIVVLQVAQARHEAAQKGAK